MTTEPPKSARHARLATLRDRFIAANLRSRSLRLQKPTRSGVFDLVRVDGEVSDAVSVVVRDLGRRAFSVDLVDEVPAAAVARAIAADVATLARAAALDEQLTGARDLAIGWPLVEGRGRDGTWLRGPLLLFGATLETAKSGRRRFVLSVDKDPLLNAPLAQALDRSVGARVSLDDLAGGDDDGVFACDPATFDGLKVTLRRLGLPLSDGGSVLPLQPLAARTVDEREAQPLSSFTLTSSLVLGRFPRAGSTIAQDYDALLATALDDDDLGAAADLVGIDDAAPMTPTTTTLAQVTTTPTTKHPLGSRRFQVLPSDKSQDEVFAFLDAPTADALVVQGPPGTGKSQLLTNLVVAAAAAGQRVLVVCQKRAALDVVAERLQGAGFQRPLALVHDVEHDRGVVCAAIARVVEASLDVSAGVAVAAVVDVDEERQRRLGDAQRAWATLMVPAPGRPCVAALQERAPPSTGASVDVSDAVDVEFGSAAARALIGRIEALAGRAAPLAAPHPLSMRGDWAGLDAAAVRALLDRVQQAAVLAAQTAADATRTPPATTMAAAAALDAAEDALAVVADAGSDAANSLLVFWGWTGGSDQKGLWKTTVKQLEKAKKKLVEVPRALFSTSAQTLTRWRSELAELSGLETRWWRFFVPRWWTLRKTPGTVLGAAQTLAPVSTTDAAAQAAALQLINDTEAWHKLLASLPDHDELALGLDGSHESIDNALRSLRTNHDHVASLHALHKSLSTHKDVDAGSGAGFQRALDLGDDDDGGFIQTVLRVRRQLRAGRAVQKAIDVVAAAFDGVVIADLRARAARGDWSSLAVQLAAFAATGQSANLTDEARALDVETRNDPPVLRAFLKRQPQTPTLDVAAAFTAAVERAWLQQALAGQDAALLEQPLVDDGALRRLGEAHRRCQSAIASTAVAAIDARLRALVADKATSRALRKLLVETQKKRRQPTLRSLTEAHWGQGLEAVMPIWLCSPESAAALFPPRAGLFDVVIFDEASQCPVESAVPALVRAKRAIIAGDDQQMPPSHFFQVARDEDDDDDSAVLASHSVLDLARATFPTTTLAWHYRSRDHRLIAFSNAAFYGNKLSSAPRAQHHGDDDDVAGVDGLSFTRVAGEWTAQANPIEAAAVVDRVVALLQVSDSSGESPSIGVIAFNQRHSELIEELLDARVASDPAVAAAWARMQQRPPTDRLFVRNLENVQGDERDVVVVSPAYGPDKSGRVFARFGPLGQQGGEKRLNVAITRARRGLHVFCSFDPQSLDVSGASHAGPKLFRLWLQTVSAAARGDDVELRRCLSDAKDLGGGRGVVDAASPEEAGVVGRVVVAELSDALRARGLRVERGFGLGRQRLDLAVGSAGGALRVGVDASFLDERDALARDVYQPSFWQRAGWTVLRVTPRMWRADPDDVVKRVLDAIGR